MKLNGRSMIGAAKDSGEGRGLRAFNPRLGDNLTRYFRSHPKDIKWAFASAETAFDKFHRKSAEEIAWFVETIATQIISLGDVLLERASAKAFLPA
jgi:alpha-ketoglutaric semialdehyde dehydrogenase